MSDPKGRTFSAGIYIINTEEREANFLFHVKKALWRGSALGACRGMFWSPVPEAPGQMPTPTSLSVAAVADGGSLRVLASPAQLGRLLGRWVWYWGSWRVPDAVRCPGDLALVSEH